MMARRTGHRDAPALDGGKCARNLSCSRRLRHVDTSPRHTISCTAGTHHSFHDIWSRMDREYFPILMLVGFVAANAVLMLLASHLTLRPRPTPVKQTPYESGIPPLGDARDRFSVKFYMVAMMFIVILAVGLAYVWKKGALQWD